MDCRYVIKFVCSNGQHGYAHPGLFPEKLLSRYCTEGNARMVLIYLQMKIADEIVSIKIVCRRKDGRLFGVKEFETK